MYTSFRFTECKFRKSKMENEHKYNVYGVLEKDIPYVQICTHIYAHHVAVYMCVCKHSFRTHRCRQKS